MKIIPYDKPTIHGGNYRVHEIRDDSDTFVGYLNVYGDGRKTFEFDSDYSYTMEQLTEILELAHNVKVDYPEPVTDKERSTLEKVNKEYANPEHRKCYWCHKKYEPMELVRGLLDRSIGIQSLTGRLFCFKPGHGPDCFKEYKESEGL